MKDFIAENSGVSQQLLSSHPGETGDPKPSYEDFCREHELPEREEAVRIYDTFMFNTELDMLEVRLTELYDVVDFFVIGAYTFSSVLTK